MKFEDVNYEEDFSYLSNSIYGLRERIEVLEELEETLKSRLRVIEKRLDRLESNDE